MDRNIWAWPIALVLGAAFGFFRIVPILFGDGPQSLVHPLYLRRHGTTLLLYAAAAFGLGWLTHRPGHPSLGLLTLPGLLLVLYFADERLGLRGLAALSIIVGVLLGVGGKLLHRKQAARDADAAPPA